MRIDEFAEIDRLANAQADKRGVRSRVDAPHAALLTAAGVFVLLDVFGWLVGAQDTDLLPGLGLTALAAVIVYAVVRSQDKSWLKRYHAAFRAIKEERASANAPQRQSPVGASLRTPEQHRQRAAQLRKNPSPEAQRVARNLEIAAKLIEGRDKRGVE